MIRQKIFTCRCYRSLIGLRWSDVLPQDLVVRESRGLLVLLALFCVVVLAGLVPLSLENLADGDWTGMDILLPSFTALFVYGAPLMLQSAWQRKVEIIAFHKGLFWPALHPDVIPWNCVESVRLYHFGQATSVHVVFSADIEAEMRMNWLARFVVKTDALIAGRGRHFGGLCDHSNNAIVHTIDDWIRYEARQALKPRYKPGVFDAVLRFLR